MRTGIGMACAFCHAPFVTKAGDHDSRRYCSPECGNWAQRTVQECEACGAEFTPKRKGRNTACSRACGFEVQRERRAIQSIRRRVLEQKRPKFCRVCFARPAGRGGVTCGGACSEVWNNTLSWINWDANRGEILTAMRERYEPKEPGDCPDCGARMSSAKRNFCGACSDARGRARRDAMNARRRSRVRGSTTAAVRRRQIFERDGWRCRLCGKPVPQDRQAPHPLSATLDHIIPLAKGGAHEPKNVQLAHFACNSAKGDRSAGSQLLLIG